MKGFTTGRAYITVRSQNTQRFPLVQGPARKPDGFQISTNYGSSLDRVFLTGRSALSTAG
jgi:hypothetical protein